MIAPSKQERRFLAENGFDRDATKKWTCRFHRVEDHVYVEVVARDGDAMNRYWIARVIRVGFASQVYRNVTLAGVLAAGALNDWA